MVNTKAFLRDKTIFMDSPVNTIFFFLLIGFVWVSLFCFELELVLEFPLSVSSLSTFSVTVLFIELILVLF